MDERDRLNRWIGEVWTSPWLKEVLHHLTLNIGPRFAGTEAERQAAHFIRKQFEKSGLEPIEFQPIHFIGWKEAHGQLSSQAEVFPVFPLAFSPPSHVTAPLVFLNEGMEQDYQDVDVQGKIVLVTSATPPDRGRMVHRMEKYKLAEGHGAVGFLFMNHYPGLLPVVGAVRFGEFGSIPGLGLSLETGKRLTHSLSRQNNVTMVVKTDIQNLTSTNVVGWVYPTSRNFYKAPILVGAHYDSLNSIPGAIDNGVAVTILLHLARVIRDFGPFLKRPVVFVAFGAEEIGLLGSKQLVQEAWTDDICLMINMDGIGSHPELQFNTQGFDKLRAQLERSSHQLGIEMEFTNFPWPYTDHWPFVQKGIPSFQIRPRKSDLGRGWGHTPADTLDKITSFNLKANAAVITQFIIHLALMEKLDIKG